MTRLSVVAPARMRAGSAGRAGHRACARFPLGVATAESQPSLADAGVAQSAEHLLPKQRVAGSNPVSRSTSLAIAA